MILSRRGNSVSAIIKGRDVDTITYCASSLIDRDTLSILCRRDNFVVLIGDTGCVSAIGGRYGDADRVMSVFDEKNILFFNFFLIDRSPADGAAGVDLIP